MKCLTDRGFSQYTNSVFIKTLVIGPRETSILINIDTGSVKVNKLELGYVLNLKEIDALIRIVERHTAQDDFLNHLIQRRSDDDSKRVPGDGAYREGTGPSTA